MDDQDFDGEKIRSPRFETEELAGLSRALQLNRGFALYFVCVSQSVHRRRLIADLSAALPDFTLNEAFVREPISNGLLNHLRQTIPGLPAPPNAAPRPAICVYGMENWLGGVDGVERSPFVAALNHTRNSFAAALGCPLIFFVPQYMLVGIQRGAPDFFSVRRGVYFFDAPPDASLRPAAEVARSPGWNAALGAGIEGRRRQVADWEDILHGYETLPIERRDPNAEARALDSLAQLHNASGDYTAAKPLYERALDIREKFFGLEHPDTATSLNNLAFLHKTQGNYAAAEPLYERALAVREKSLGPEHPITATSLNNLASLYKSQGDYTAAEPLYERGLAIWQISLGPEHPNTAASLNNLGSLYQSQGNYAAAKPLYERSLAIYEKSFGLEHPNTAASLNNLASLYQAQGDYIAAEPLIRRATGIVISVLGTSHPTAQLLLRNWAATLDELGRTEEANEKRAMINPTVQTRELNSLTPSKD